MATALPNSFRKARGFTFVEMLAAISISALFLGTSALAMYAITQNGKHFSSNLTIPLGEATKTALYGVGGESIRTPSCPNPGRLPFVLEMRDQFLEDVAMSEGVYCLARSTPGTLRSDSLSWPYEITSADRPSLDTPEAFRLFLTEVDPTAAAVFSSVRNAPPTSAPNTSIFLVGSTDQSDQLGILAVYEIDYLPIAKPTGVFATVRRFKADTLTHYYDVFYPEGPSDPLLPTFITFESESRQFVTEGNSIDRFKIAPRSPFYLIWFPDPTLNPFQIPSTPSPTDPSDPRSSYGHLVGKTSFLVVAPMFPNL